MLIILAAVTPCIAGGKPAPSPVSMEEGAATPDAPEFSDADAQKRGRQLKSWLDQFGKTKKAAATLSGRIEAMRGETVIVSGVLMLGGNPAMVRDDKVDYLFYLDPHTPRMPGLMVWVACKGAVSYIDPVKKIVILDGVKLRWLASD
jgi:hypothetical protein